MDDLEATLKEMGDQEDVIFDDSFDLKETGCKEV